MIFETFARRKLLRSRAGEPDVYTYDDAPERMRQQICIAFAEGIGPFYLSNGFDYNSPPNANNLWAEIDRICRKELRSYLPLRPETDLSQRFLSFLHNVSELDDFLSGVEIGCIALLVAGDRHDLRSERGTPQSGSEINFGNQWQVRAACSRLSV